MRKFYCQFCGAEVPLNAGSCPKCLKEFGSVLCPKCNYSGGAIRFVNGCPKCGYLKEPESRTPQKKRKVFNLTFRLFAIMGSLLLISIIILIRVLIT